MKHSQQSGVYTPRVEKQQPRTVGIPEGVSREFVASGAARPYVPTVVTSAVENHIRRIRLGSFQFHRVFASIRMLALRTIYPGVRIFPPSSTVLAFRLNDL